MVFRLGYDWWGGVLERLLGVLKYHMGTAWYACSLAGFRGWVAMLQCVVMVADGVAIGYALQQLAPCVIYKQHPFVRLSCPGYFFSTSAGTLCQQIRGSLHRTQ